jgi:hypothetical protein
MPESHKAGQMGTTNEIHRETYKLEAMKYDILISPSSDGAFHGEWQCPSCDRGDVSAVRLPDEKAARQWARHCVAIHHALVHSE